MIVCLCTGATDRDINDVIDQGASCLCDFRSRGIGTSCGSCHDSIRLMMVARGVAIQELCFEEAIIARIAGREFSQCETSTGEQTAPMRIAESPAVASVAR